MSNEDFQAKENCHSCKHSNLYRDSMFCSSMGEELLSEYELALPCDYYEADVCSYCNKDNYNQLLFEYDECDGSMEMQIEGQGMRLWHQSTSDCSCGMNRVIEIKHCPMCGEELKEKRMEVR